MTAGMVQAATRLVRQHNHVNWALADQTMVSGVNFLTGILIARYLGVDEFGRFTLAWMVVLFAASIQHAAINAPMMSIGPKQPEADAPAYFGAVVIQQVLFGAASFALVFASATFAVHWFPEWKIDGVALPLAAATVAYQLQDFLRRYFFTRGRGHVAFATDAIRYLGQLVLLLWLFFAYRNAMNSNNALWAITAAATVSAIVASVPLERLEWSPLALCSITTRHWRFSKWFTASALMQWTSGNLFQLTAGALLGSSAVGALKAAQTLVGAIHVFFHGLENIVPVRAAAIYHCSGKTGLVNYLRVVALWGGGITLVFTVAIALFPDVLLEHVYGKQYVEAASVLQLYSCAYLLMFCGVILRAGLRATESTYAIFWSSTLGAVVTFATAYTLVTLWTLEGAAIGNLFVQFIVVFVLALSLKKQLSLQETP